MIFLLYLLSWTTWSLLTSTCRFKYAPRSLNQRSDKSKLRTLNIPKKLFITNWKLKRVVFFLVFGSFDLKNVKKSGGPCARLSFVDLTKNVHFLKVMKMRCFPIFNDFDHKDKLIIKFGNLTLLDDVCQWFQVKILTTFSSLP